MAALLLVWKASLVYFTLQAWNQSCFQRALIPLREILLYVPKYWPAIQLQPGMASYEKAFKASYLVTGCDQRYQSVLRKENRWFSLQVAIQEQIYFWEEREQKCSQNVKTGECEKQGSPTNTVFLFLLIRM